MPTRRSVIDRPCPPAEIRSDLWRPPRNLGGRPPRDDRTGPERRRRFHGDGRLVAPAQDFVEAGQRVVQAPRAHERPGQPGHVTDRGSAPPLVRGVARIEQRDESGEGADVLVVVADHGRQGSRRPAAQEAEVAPGISQPSTSSCRSTPEQRLFDRPQPRIVHPVPEQPADDRQQVEVTVVDRCRAPCQPVAGDEQRPVEPAPVVGHEPGIRGRHGGPTRRAGLPRRHDPGAAAGPGGTSSRCHQPRPMRNATVPAAVARPVVSVSRQTSGRSAGGWPGNRASRSRSTGRSMDRPSTRTKRPERASTTSPSSVVASRSARSVRGTGAWGRGPAGAPGSAVRIADRKRSRRRARSDGGRAGRAVTPGSPRPGPHRPPARATGAGPGPGRRRSAPAVVRCRPDSRRRSRRQR